MTIEGIKVINATSNMTFYISPEHAKEGKPMDIEGCPGALGCLTVPGVKRAQVYKSRLFALKDVYIDNVKELVWERYNVPKTLMIQEAIIDNGGRFASGYYTVTAPPPSKRTGKQQGSNARPDKEQHKPRTKPTKTPMRINAPTKST